MYKYDVYTYIYCRYIYIKVYPSCGRPGIPYAGFHCKFLTGTPWCFQFFCGGRGGLDNDCL
jgi:hypothetical protein